jgi:hypothetical protein
LFCRVDSEKLIWLSLPRLLKSDFVVVAELILRSLKDVKLFFSQSDSKYHPDPHLVMYVIRTHRITDPNKKI